MFLSRDDYVLEPLYLGCKEVYTDATNATNSQRRSAYMSGGRSARS
jgi:hypothetical protein